MNTCVRIRGLGESRGCDGCGKEKQNESCPPLLLEIMPQREAALFIFVANRRQHRSGEDMPDF